MVAEARGDGNAGEGVLAGQHGQAHGERAFVLLGIGRVEQLGDHQAEHAIAEEFQPFIAALLGRAGPRRAGGRRRRARMGEGLAQQRGLPEAVAEGGGQLFGKLGGGCAPQ